MSIEVTKYQQDSEFTSRASEDEIDLRELFAVIWQGKWLIIAITTLFAIGSVVFALSQPNIYKSEALIASASAEQGNGLAALAGQFGGLASMAGINLGSSIDKTQLAIEVIKSRQFISDFIQRHNILPNLMAVKSWNIADNSIVYDKAIYDFETQKWVRKADYPFKPQPSLQEAYIEFSGLFQVNKSKETGLVTVSIEHMSPFIAHQWTVWIIEDINRIMKERDVAEAKRSAEFLNRQIALTNVADIRAVLYRLIEEQAKIIMFAEVREEYIFKTIDPSVVSELKFKPKRAIICLLGTILGFILAIVFIFIRNAFRVKTYR